jgi:integrase
MARRSGQIISKGKDKWLIRIFIGRDKATDKRLYDGELVEGNKSDAQKVLNKKLTSNDNGQLAKKTSITLKEYLKKWLQTIAKARVREATYDSYEYHLDHYLFEQLGGFKLSKLQTFDIQKYYNEMSEKYSPRTVQYVHTILKNALKKAVEMRYIADNPCNYVELPKKQKREIKVFSSVEAKMFLEAAQNDKHGLIFEFALLTGARPEEYLALKWSDLDISRGIITFQRTLIWRKGGGWYFDEQMKTTHSRRTIPLPKTLLEKVKKHRIKQAEQILKIGAIYERNNLIFATDEGQPLRYGNLTNVISQDLIY